MLFHRMSLNEEPCRTSASSGLVNSPLMLNVLLPLILAHRIYNFLWFSRDLIQTPYEISLFSFYGSLLIM